MQNDFYLFKYFNLNGEIEIESVEKSGGTPKKKKRFDLLKDILIKKEIYIPSLEKLNDPFECLIPRQEKDPIGVLSFTTNNNHPLMWAHYSDGHTGVVLQFKVNKSSYEDFKKVQYIHHRSELALLKPFRVKSVDWNYENEYRLIFDFHSKIEKIKNLGLELEGILFGHRCCEKNKQEIRDVCLAFDYKWGGIILDDDLRCQCLGMCTEEEHFIWDNEASKRKHDEEEYRASLTDDDYSNYPTENPASELYEKIKTVPEFQDLLKRKEQLKALYHNT